MPFYRETCIKLFKTFSKNTATVNLFELLSLMVLTAYANAEDKLRILFCIYDFNS